MNTTEALAAFQVADGEYQLARSRWIRRANNLSWEVVVGTTWDARERARENLAEVESGQASSEQLRLF